MSAPTRVSIVGGTGYVAGELLRLLLGHPAVEVAQVASRSKAGGLLRAAHPHLRGRTDLRFSAPEALEPEVRRAVHEPLAERRELLDALRGLAVGQRGDQELDPLELRGRNEA